MKIFISYGHDENAEVVNELCRKLEERGHEIWIDHTKIETGDLWRNSIQSGILESDDVIAFLSKHSLRPEGVCLDEIKIAICVKQADIKTVIMEEPGKINPPASLCYRQWLDLSCWKSEKEKGKENWDAWIQKQFDRLITMIDSEKALKFEADMEKLEEMLNPIIADSKEFRLLQKPYQRQEELEAAVELWRTDPNGRKLKTLFGGAGTGKSMFIANMLHYNPYFITAFFCEVNKNSYYSAQRLICTLAYKIAVKIPDYRKMLLQILNAELRKSQQMKEEKQAVKSAPALFENYILEPLCSLIYGGRETQIIAIDGLDEASEDANTFAKILRDHMEAFPKWIRFLVTARPKEELVNTLYSADNLIIENSSSAIRRYLQTRLGDRFGKTDILRVVEKCGTSFVFAEAVTRDLLSGVMAIHDIESLPQDMNGYYSQMFDRTMSAPERYDCAKLILSALLSETRTSLGIMQAVFKMILKKDTTDLFRETCNRLVQMNVICEQGEGYFGFTHKSISDWLENKNASGKYFVDATCFNRLLGSYIWEQRENLFASGDKDSRFLCLNFGSILKNAEMWPEYIEFLKSIYGEETWFGPSSSIYSGFKTNNFWIDKENYEEQQFFYIDDIPTYFEEAEQVFELAHSKMQRSSRTIGRGYSDQDIESDKVLDFEGLSKYSFRTKRMAGFLFDSIKEILTSVHIWNEYEKPYVMKQVYYLDRCMEKCKENSIPVEDEIKEKYHRNRVAYLLAAFGDEKHALGNALELYLDTALEQENVDTSNSFDVYKLHHYLFECFHILYPYEEDQEKLEQEALTWGFGFEPLEKVHISKEMLQTYHTVCLALFFLDTKREDTTIIEAARCADVRKASNAAMIALKNQYDKLDAEQKERITFIENIQKQYQVFQEKTLVFGEQIRLCEEITGEILKPYRSNALVASENPCEPYYCGTTGHSFLVLPIHYYVKDDLYDFSVQKQCLNVLLQGETGAALNGQVLSENNHQTGFLYRVPNLEYRNQELYQHGLMQTELFLRAKKEDEGDLFFVFTVEDSWLEENKKISIQINSIAGNYVTELCQEEIEQRRGTTDSNRIFEEGIRAYEAGYFSYALRLFRQLSDHDAAKTKAEEIKEILAPFNCHIKTGSANGGLYDGVITIQDGMAKHISPAQKAYYELYADVDHTGEKRMVLGRIEPVRAMADFQRNESKSSVHPREEAAWTKEVVEKELTLLASPAYVKERFYAKQENETNQILIVEREETQLHIRCIDSKENSYEFGLTSDIEV